MTIYMWFKIIEINMTTHSETVISLIINSWIYMKQNVNYKITIGVSLTLFDRFQK